jgi:hypothetical protein
LAWRVKILPRLASVAAFLCFMVDHLECPDIGQSPDSGPHFGRVFRGIDQT